MDGERETDRGEKKMETREGGRDLQDKCRGEKETDAERKKQRGRKRID